MAYDVSVSNAGAEGNIVEGPDKVDPKDEKEVLDGKATNREEGIDGGSYQDAAKVPVKK